ncbi:hypothetical protein [Paraburkholderia adhaesiva]|uniref:hypothetical protein n=1 Tax=Paraburkholderia adhaesiva TaxID=2883244 RepID=UPI001F3F4990|nr:hypothetical protein [Paraburkholderia adhaesiva]
MAGFDVPAFGAVTFGAVAFGGVAFGVVLGAAGVLPDFGAVAVVPDFTAAVAAIVRVRGAVLRVAGVFELTGIMHSFDGG